MEHIRHDHGKIQFIAAGFKGDRTMPDTWSTPGGNPIAGAAPCLVLLDCGAGSGDVGPDPEGRSNRTRITP